MESDLYEATVTEIRDLVIPPAAVAALWPCGVFSTDSVELAPGARVLRADFP